ncbi:hypothetical protein GCM10027053_03710 [Intrasporangium mesophilum]
MPGPGPWATSEQIREVYDADAAGTELLREVTADEVWEALRTVDDISRQMLLSAIGLHTNRAPSRTAAAQLLARLRTGAADVREMRASMEPAVIKIFDGTIGPVVWSLLLAADDELVSVLAAQDPVMSLTVHAFLRNANPTFTPLALMGAITSDLGMPSLALGVLALTDPAAKRAWDQLEAQGAPLPPAPVRSLAGLNQILTDTALLPDEGHSHPAGLPMKHQGNLAVLEDYDAAELLRNFSQLLSLVGADEDALNDSDPNDAENAESDDYDDLDDYDDAESQEIVNAEMAHQRARCAQLVSETVAALRDGAAGAASLEDTPQADVAGWVFDLLGYAHMLDDLQKVPALDGVQDWASARVLFAVTAHLTGEVARQLESGDRPDGLRQLAALLTVLSKLELPAVGAAAWLNGRVRDAQAAEEASARAEQDRLWLTELTTIVGPGSLESEIATVAAAANAQLSAAGDAGDDALEALQTLHHFLRISQEKAAGAQIGFDDLFSSEGAARKAWPQLAALLSAAASGYLAMPPSDPSDVAPGRPDPAAGTDHPVVTSPDAPAQPIVISVDTDDTLEGTTVTGNGDAAHNEEQAAPGVDAHEQGPGTDGNTSGASDTPASAGQDEDGLAPDRQPELNPDAPAGPPVIEDDTASEPADRDDIEPDKSLADGPAVRSSDDDVDGREGLEGAGDEDDRADDDDDQRADEHDDPSTDAASTVAAAPADGAFDVDLSELDSLLAAGAGAALLPARARAAVAATKASAPVPEATLPGTPAGADEVAAPERAASNGADEVQSAPLEDADSFDWSSDLVQDAAAAAAGDLRFGLAADIALAAAAPPASVSARRLGAYAHQLRNPSGHLAAAFSEEAATLTRDALSEDRDGQLIAWAAAARVALLAPHAGPARVLTELAPCVADQSGLSTIGDALIEASRSGVIVLPEAGAALGTVTDAEQALADAHTRLNDLLATSGRRALNFQPANAIYQEWLLSTGPLGAGLLTAASGTVEDVPAVRQTVTELRGQGTRRAETAHRRSKRSSKIFEPVMRDLNARWEDILDALEAWCDAVTRVRATTEHVSTGSWQTAALAEVRSRISATVREQALESLTVDEESDPRGAFISDAVTELLQETFNACDGQAPDGDEPTPALAVHGDLLPLAVADLPAELRITDAAQLRPHLPAMLELADEPAPTLEETYGRLKEAGHHDQTALLISLARTGNSTHAAVLDRDRGLAVAERLTRRAGALATLRRRLDTQRMSGGLTEEDWSTLSTRVDALGDESRRDFGRILLESQQIHAELETLQQARIEETRARIDERAAASPLVAEQAERLTQLAAQGNIASAEEYLEQLASGESLPDDDADHNVHLAQFYPSVPDVFETEPKTGEQFAAFLRNTDNLRQLVSQPAAAGGPEQVLRGQGLTGLAALVQRGHDLFGMSRGRLDEARRAIDGLRELRRNPASKQFPTGSLGHVLAQAGYEFARAVPDAPTQARRRWVNLTGVTATGRALTPALGSAKSPDGASLRVLLVWGDQQPQSLMDWVRDEAADRSVIAVWLGTALTTDQRRELAGASRGRPKPLVAVLDEAALMYLCAQPVRTLATFASIALPFTALSPYKDTPGVAAPEMFYGRRHELEQVKDLTGPSFVSGGRQLGKSALLRAAEASFPTEGPGRVAILRSIYPIGQDGNSATLWSALWADLHAKGITTGPLPHDGIDEAVHASIRAWIDADGSRALLILLDEADAFLDADADGNRFTAVDRCRRLMLETRQRVKFVFTGLHRTARFDSLPNQPLSHLGQITVGPLAPRHAHELITRPLAAIGFTYQDPIGTPARILALANNMPALLQLFGAALVRHLTSRPLSPGMPPDQITDEDIETVWDDPVLRAEFREKYVLTLNLDHRFLVIAYTIAYAAHMHGAGYGLTLNELSEQARGNWPEGFAACGADDFRALVTECVDLGLLARDGNRYRMRTPTVLRLLGTQDEVIDTLATASERLTVPTPGLARSFRRRSGEGRSPLTERQLADVLAGLGQTTLITGCEGTGLGCVANALQDALSARDVSTQARALQVLPTARIADMLTAVERAEPRTVVFVDARGVNPAALTGLAAAADDATAGTRVGVVLLADSPSGAAWPEVTRRVSLARVDVPGLRLLCDDAGLPFHDDASVSLLHRATGGWPELVAHALTLPSGNSGMTVETILAEAQRHAQAHRQALVRSVFPARAALLATMFDKVAELTEDSAEDAAAIAETLLLDRDLFALLAQARVVTPVPGPCPATGTSTPATVRDGADSDRGDIDELLQTLADLDLVMTAPDGAIQAEPVLAAARAAARPLAGVLS